MNVFTFFRLSFETISMIQHFEFFLENCFQKQISSTIEIFDCNVRIFFQQTLRQSIAFYFDDVVDLFDVWHVLVQITSLQIRRVDCKKQRLFIEIFYHDFQFRVCRISIKTNITKISSFSDDHVFQMIIWIVDQSSKLFNRCHFVRAQSDESFRIIVDLMTHLNVESSVSKDRMTRKSLIFVKHQMLVIFYHKYDANSRIIEWDRFMKKKNWKCHAFNVHRWVSFVQKFIHHERHEQWHFMKIEIEFFEINFSFQMRLFDDVIDDIRNAEICNHWHFFIVDEFIWVCDVDVSIIARRFDVAETTYLAKFFDSFQHFHSVSRVSSIDWKSNR